MTEDSGTEKRSDPEADREWLTDQLETLWRDVMRLGKAGNLPPETVLDTLGSFARTWKMLQGHVLKYGLKPVALEDVDVPRESLRAGLSAILELEQTSALQALQGVSVLEGQDFLEAAGRAGMAVKAHILQQVRGISKVFSLEITGNAVKAEQTARLLSGIYEKAAGMKMSSAIAAEKAGSGKLRDLCFADALSFLRDAGALRKSLGETALTLQAMAGKDMNGLRQVVSAVRNSPGAHSAQRFLAEYEIRHGTFDVVDVAGPVVEAPPGAIVFHLRA
ncbi:MAG: hypothetical protein M3O22_05680 [Pseudomonadota bacterium]|nr:hypothetical protein [Pseudomonadota bacterium]